MISPEQSCWFEHKVVWWRSAASVAWSVLLLPASTVVFVVLSRFSFLHPIRSTSECFTLLTSVTSFFPFILLCLVVLTVGLLNLKYYRVVPTIACSKVALLAQLLHPRQFAISLVHCIMGVAVAWCCAVTIGGRYQNLDETCTQSDGSSQRCLNEYQLFLLLAGAFAGWYHSLLGVVHNINYVSFNTVQQYKYLRFKGSLPLVVKCSITQALYSVRNYIVLYFFLGHIPRTWVCNMLNLQVNSSVHPLDGVAGLLDVSLLYHLWITGTFLLLTWYITLLLFRIFVTEAYTFPVQLCFTEEVHQCLPKVLTVKQPMILKFLALQDLALLSQHTPSRRREVFMLSQPGGHPHNWNAISTECLCLLADLTQRLVTYHDTVATNGRNKLQSTGSDCKTSSETTTLGTEEPLTPRPSMLIKTPASVFSLSLVGAQHSPLTAPFTPDLDSPFSSPALRRLTAPVEQCSPWYGSVQSPHIMRRAPKLWSTSTDSPANGSHPPSPAAIPPPKLEVSKPSFLALFLQNRKEQLPEASSQALFADSQAHIWALEGLSYLVKTSFSEDQFGVVQTSLPSILGSMLLLQEAVDRHFKLPHASSKPIRTARSMGDATYKTLRFALRATLKTAIYRITTTFGDHLNAVQMSAEHRKRLQQFLEFKE
ncbi:nucleoporin NDC1 isoform X2 [Thalassophryne amazonica]|uniref:nucleoporin NDC1 isoform X2 n=1 Tax=Thalassophryne amazonica TaxID=390379 RepID=UPI001470E926|nr:nucleoporin NDC1 isoform X2 [Thalassophryne amazonica]